MLESLLDASGEPILPLVAWTMRDAPGVKEYGCPELLELMRRRDAFRSDYIQGMHGLGYLGCKSSLTTGRVEYHGAGNGRDSLPLPPQSGSFTGHLVLLGLHVDLEPARLPRDRVSCHQH